jgi:flagellar biosynthesis GTPase FlhF
MSEQRYRFVVGSAEEAVSVLRQRFGARARVVSVRQVEGRGLARFLQAPKLEVIAAVGTRPCRCRWQPRLALLQRLRRNPLSRCGRWSPKCQGTRRLKAM